jgi:hypothetical protein
MGRPDKRFLAWRLHLAMVAVATDKGVSTGGGGEHARRMPSRSHEARAEALSRYET